MGRPAFVIHREDLIAVPYMLCAAGAGPTTRLGRLCKSNRYRQPPSAKGLDLRLPASTTIRPISLASYGYAAVKTRLSFGKRSF